MENKLSEKKRIEQPELKLIPIGENDIIATSEGTPPPSPFEAAMTPFPTVN